MSDPIFRNPPESAPRESVVGPLHFIDWGLVDFGIPAAWKESEGAGIRFLILDTGIDLKHVDLAGQIEDARDFTRSRSGVYDSNGHGTFCASVILAPRNQRGMIGVCPKAKGFVGKVLGDDGSGSGRSILEAFKWGLDLKPHIISMSLGTPFDDPYMREACEMAVAAGVIVVCAAGNSGPNNRQIDYPGKLPSTIAVASVRQGGALSEYSSRGPEVDVAGPGENVLGASAGGGWVRMSGTSMSTPWVAGVIGLLKGKHLAHGGATPVDTVEQVREHLRRHAKDVGAPGHDTGYGMGLINVDSLLHEDPAPPDPVPGPAAPAVEFDLGRGYRLRSPALGGETWALETP